MRWQGQYADSGGNAYVSAQMQHMPAKSLEQKSGHFQGQLETPDRDQPYGTPKSDGQWRWERDGSKVSNPMAAKYSMKAKGLMDQELISQARSQTIFRKSKW